MPSNEDLINEGGIFNHENSNEIYNIRFWDRKNGLILNPKHLESLEFSEDLFSLLPTVRIKISDKGIYFSGYNIKNGDPIYVTITPSIRPKGEEPKPYINSMFCVQSINCVPRY